MRRKIIKIFFTRDQRKQKINKEKLFDVIIGKDCFTRLLHLFSECILNFPIFITFTLGIVLSALEFSLTPKNKTIKAYNS